MDEFSSGFPWGIYREMFCTIHQHKHVHNSRKVTVLLKGSIFVMHHLFKTMSAGEGLKN